MNDFVFIKSRQHKETKKRLKQLSYVCQMALKYGGHKKDFITDKNIYEVWEKGIVPPSVTTLYRAFNYEDMKWFIKNHVQYTDLVWNNDFIHGVMASCAKRGLNKHFDTLVWGGNRNIERLFNDSPFGGRTFHRTIRGRRFKEYHWIAAPAQELDYDEKAMSFMAGVLAGGEIKNRFGVNTAQYSIRVLPYIKKWGIPIEHETKNWFLISPIWPALFTPYMPETEKDYWLSCENPWMGSLYAAFLWRLYVHKDKYRSGGIPFLKGRRRIYYMMKKKFAGQRPMKALEQIGRDCQLYSLDNRISQTIVMWSHLTDPSV